MKKMFLFLLAMTAAALGAVELEIDGKFNDFNNTWRISSHKIGTVEVVPDKGVNYVQLAAEEGIRSSIGILTAGMGVQSKKGDEFTISVDVKGGPLEIALLEYGNKKYLGSSKKIFKASKKSTTYKVTFSVRELTTDAVRFRFQVKRGAAAVISNVKVDQKSSAAPAK